MVSCRVLAPLLALLLPGAPGRAADPKLPPKHVKAGVLCVDCHREEKPTKAAVADESCIACHGDLPAMAAYTKAAKPNPHLLPKGHTPATLACTECHHQHRPAEVKCQQCHPDFHATAR